MTWELRISSEAEACIDEQQQWYESDEKHGGAILANRWLASIEVALGELCQRPERHGFAPENGRWRPELKIRQMRFKPWKTRSAWRVLYVLDETKGIIALLQVRQEHRRRLFEGD
jgi:hypothetical protein